jgi:hypothetical protein
VVGSFQNSCQQSHLCVLFPPLCRLPSLFQGMSGDPKTSSRNNTVIYNTLKDYFSFWTLSYYSFLSHIAFVGGSQLLWRPMETPTHIRNRSLLLKTPEQACKLIQQPCRWQVDCNLRIEPEPELPS